MEFKYTTQIGTKVVLTINSFTEITARALDKEIICDATKGFVYNYKVNPPMPAISTDLRISGKHVSLEITEEIKSYINACKEEERIASLPRKEQIIEKIKKLENQTNFTYFVDADLVTGIKYFALSEKYDKNIWNKISKYFEYISTSHHSDDFDAMYDSNYKGWLTNNPAEVECILKKETGIDNTEEIGELKKELEDIKFKEENDAKYREELFKKSVQKLQEKYPAFSEKIDEVASKTSGFKDIADNNIVTGKIIDILLEEMESSLGQPIYDPENLTKVISSIYAGGYRYLSKEENVKVIPTENHIVVVHKPKYSEEWWNVMGHEIINGFFAEFGACYIRVYEYQEGILNLLKDLGFKSETYYEVSEWFLVGTSNYRDDLCNIVALSDDYNYNENEEEVLEKYKREEPWEWKLENRIQYPTLSEVKRVGKFKILD